jgi:hypothetical protein
MNKVVFIFSLIFSVGAFSQVVPNDDFYKNCSLQNTVDSISVFRIVNFATNNFDLVTVEKIDEIELEISSRGALIDIVSPGIIENFQYEGGKSEMDVIKFEGGVTTTKASHQVYQYNDKNSKAKSFFYFFPEQKNLLYRRISKKKKSDIIIYHLTAK